MQASRDAGGPVGLAQRFQSDAHRGPPVRALQQLVKHLGVGVAVETHLDVVGARDRAPDIDQRLGVVELVLILVIRVREESPEITHTKTDDKTHDQEQAQQPKAPQLQQPPQVQHAKQAALLSSRDVLDADELDALLADELGDRKR